MDEQTSKRPAVAAAALTLLLRKPAKRSRISPADGHKRMEFYRVLYVLEQEEEPTRIRVERLRSLWIDVHSNFDLTQIDTLHDRVICVEKRLRYEHVANGAAACQQVEELAFRRSNSVTFTTTFEKRDEETAFDDVSCSARSKNNTIHMLNNVTIQSPTRHAQPWSAPPIQSVEALQMEQRAHIENDIVNMTARLKEETQRFQLSLIQQNSGIIEGLDRVVDRNVCQVTDVGNDTRAYNLRSSWKSRISTWTLLFTIAIAFLLTLVTIQVAPKRQGACIFWCKKRPLSSKVQQEYLASAPHRDLFVQNHFMK
jgi:hypothetical protein